MRGRIKNDNGSYIYSIPIPRSLLWLGASFPSLVDDSKKHSADPWIIALAIDMNKQTSIIETREVIVVTNEKLRGKRVKIPFVCKHFGIRYMSLLEMLRAERWKF